MRISSQQVFDRALSGIQNANRNVADTQDQIASGKKILNPSDDPVASTRILALNRELALREQYGENIGAARSRLELEESTLTRFQAVVGRIRELTQQAGNATLGQTDRQFIASEIEARHAELVGLMNARDASGEYLFAGHQGGEQPFRTVAGGATVYEGDEGQRSLRISESTVVPIGDNGKRLFVDLPASRTRFAIEPHPGNDPVGAAAPAFRSVYDQALLDAAAASEFVVEFQDPNAVAPPSTNVTVRERDSGRIVTGLENRPFDPGTPIRFSGIEIVIAGSPQPGDAFMVRTTGTESMVDAVDRLQDVLRRATDTPEDQVLLQTELQAALDAFDTQEERILQVRSEIGARINTVDSIEDLHDQLDLVARDALSEIRDLDYAEAVSRLNFQSFVLEAAQRGFARTANLSLFDLL